MNSNAGMEHRKFFEEQANKNANQSASRTGPPTNNFSDEQQNGGIEKPKLKKITSDMPKWKKDKFLKENEKLKEDLRRIEEQEKEEQNKWVGIPPWKVKILKEKEALQKQKEEEKRQMQLREEKEKKEWESLPTWKQNLLAMKGVSRLTKKFEENQSTVNHVTRADTDEEGTSENSSDIPEDDGDNSEDSIGENDIEQEEPAENDEGKAAEEEIFADEEQDEQVPIENGLERGEDEDSVEFESQELEETREDFTKEEAEEEAGEKAEEKLEEDVNLMEVDSPSPPSSTELYFK